MRTQLFKSIYFKEEDAFEFAGGKRVTVSFSEKDRSIFDSIYSLSNEEIREIIKVDTYKQLVDLSSIEDRTLSKFIKHRLKKSIPTLSDLKPADVTFQNSKRVPFQRWFPYVEGYSPDFVTTLLKKYAPIAKTVFDPFAGTGTTYFSADNLSLKSYYSEVNPLLVFLSEVKIEILSLNETDRHDLADKIKSKANTILEDLKESEEDLTLASNYSDLFGSSKYYDEKTFSKILRIRNFLDSISETDLLLSRILTVAVVSILLKVSYLKKMGDVRFKTKKELEKENYSIDIELLAKLKEVSEDIRNVDCNLKSKPEFLLYNSKKINLLNDLNIDAVVTSPPYLNGTNYLRNTKIELWFLRQIRYANDLRGLRDQIVTSGINDVRAKNGTSTKELNVFDNQLLEDTLIRLRKDAYDNRIPIMVESYFHEMYSVFDGLRYSLNNDSKIMIDIGDSIFAGVHIPTDKILADILIDMGGYTLEEKTTLRKRRSRNKNILTQELLVFSFKGKPKAPSKESYFNIQKWKEFGSELPHQKNEFLKKNWGHSNHSLCSYGGKLKPAIAHHLVSIFVPDNGKVFDPFSGVGTIPFEAALMGKKSFGMDISKPAFFISSAKVTSCDRVATFKCLDKLRSYIESEQLRNDEIEIGKSFGFNKKLNAYFEKTTLKEILLARRYFQLNSPVTAEEMLVVSSLLHVLHGNRPYALSRRSHPITPYAPTGEFEYKNVCDKVRVKVEKTLSEPLSECFVDGSVYLHDSTDVWPQDINDLDAVITSPPFFDSTRFYLANWMRIWFCGWNESDFRGKINLFVEEKQKKSFDVYDNIFRQARERLKIGGVFVLHLGKSSKCDMAEEIIRHSMRYFKKYDLFSECVKHCQSHGIRDKGSVTNHQYLILH